MVSILCYLIQHYEVDNFHGAGMIARLNQELLLSYSECMSKDFIGIKSLLTNLNGCRANSFFFLCKYALLEL